MNVDSLTYNPDIPPEIESYSQNQNFSFYEDQNKTNKDDIAYKAESVSTYVCSKCNNTNTDEDVNMKDIQIK